MRSLKQIINEENIKLTKLKQFGIDTLSLEQFIDVSFMPNPLAYKTMPKIFAATSGEVFEYDKRDGQEMLQSSPLLIADFCDDDDIVDSGDMLSESTEKLWSEEIINSTWQTTQHILSHDSILESDP